MLLPPEVPPFKAPQQRPGDAIVKTHAGAVAVLRETNFHKPPIPRVPIRTSRILLTMFLSLDPPAHTRLRRVVAPFFTPPAIAEHRDLLYQLAERTLDDAPDHFDVVRDFAYPYTFAFACHLMGAREDDRPQLSGWIRTLTAALDEPLSLRKSDILPIVRALASRSFRPVEAYRAGSGMVRYADDRLADTDTPITQALRDAVKAGDITKDEATSTWLLLFIAGHETAANLIANAVHALARHPGELAKVLADPTLVASAVEETLRWDPPVPLNVRTAQTPARVADTEVAVGHAAFLSIRDANRDPRAVADGDDFRVGRVPEAPHLVDVRDIP